MPNPSTPTYDDLSALCAQMAATLEAIKGMSGPMALRSAKAMAEIALTAYSTLSPDPQWQRVPAKPSAEIVQAAIDTFGMPPSFKAMERAIVAAFNRARGEG